MGTPTGRGLTLAGLLQRHLSIVQPPPLHQVLHLRVIQADQLLLGLNPVFPAVPRTPKTRGSNVVAEHPAVLKREILEPSNQVALQRLTNTVLDESYARGLESTVKPESVEPAAVKPEPVDQP